MYEDELLWALNASELVKENESVRDMREEILILIKCLKTQKKKTLEVEY